MMHTKIWLGRISLSIVHRNLTERWYLFTVEEAEAQKSSLAVFIASRIEER